MNYLFAVHGDIKPSNFLLVRNKTTKGTLVKVCDFGLSRKLDENSSGVFSLSQSNRFFSAPECFHGELKKVLCFWAECLRVVNCSVIYYILFTLYRFRQAMVTDLVQTHNLNIKQTIKLDTPNGLAWVCVEVTHRRYRR